MSFPSFILHQISNPAGSKDSQSTKAEVFSAVWKIRVGYRCEYFGNLTCQISVMAVNHQCCSQTRADTQHTPTCVSFPKQTLIFLMIEQAPASARTNSPLGSFHGQQWKFLTGKSELSENSKIPTGKAEVPTAFTEWLCTQWHQIFSLHKLLLGAWGLLAFVWAMILCVVCETEQTWGLKWA